MPSASGMVLAAGGLVVANEAIFAPLESHKPVLQNFNWRIVPATIILAIVVGGLEDIVPPFGKVLGGLTLLAALTIPVGNAPTPLDNAGKAFSNVGATFGGK